MLKCVNKIFLFIFIMFTFLLNANAECSYQERKEMLDLVKEVKINFNAMTKEVIEMLENPNSGDIESAKITTDYLQLNISGLKDGYYIIITDTSTGEEITLDNKHSNKGVYTLNIDNIENVVTYNVDFYSNYENCFASKITSKKITKPKKNYLNDLDICSDDKVSENKYCNKYIIKDFELSEGQIINLLKEKIKEETISSPKEKLNYINFIKEYWYIPCVLIIVAIVVIIMIKVRKKRGEL